MDSYCGFALLTLLITAAKVYGQACPEGSNVAQMCVPGTYSGERVLIDTASYNPAVSNCSCIFATNSSVTKLVTYVAPNYPECNSALRLYSSSGNSIRFQCLMSGTYLDTSQYNAGVTTFETYGDLYDKNYCLVLEVAGRVGDTITVTCSADMPSVQTTTAPSASLDKTGDINNTVTNINDNTVDMALEQSAIINETSSPGIEFSIPGASATATQLPAETTTLYNTTIQHNGTMTDVNDLPVDLVMEQSTNTNETSSIGIEISTRTSAITTQLPKETTTLYSSVIEHNGTMTNINDLPVDLVMGQSINTNETSSSGIEMSSTTGDLATTTKQSAITTTLYNSTMEHNSTMTDTNDTIVDLVMEQSTNTNDTSSSGIEMLSTIVNSITTTRQPAEPTTQYSSTMEHKITVTDINDITFDLATNTNETGSPSLEMLTTETSAPSIEPASDITSQHSPTKQQHNLDTTTRRPVGPTTFYSSTTQHSEPENVTHLPHNLDLIFTSSVFDYMNDTDSAIQNDTVDNVDFSAATRTSNITEPNSKDTLTAVVTGTILFNGGGSGASKTIQNIDSIPAEILLDDKQLTEKTTSNQILTASDAPVSRSNTFNQVSEAPLLEKDFHSQYDIPVATLPTDISNSLIMRASSSSTKSDISGVTDNIPENSNTNYSIQFPSADPLTVAAKQNTTSPVDLKTMYAFDTHKINHTLNFTNEYESSNFNNNTSFIVNKTDTGNNTMFDVETSGYQTDRFAITMESPAVTNTVSSTDITVNAFRTSPYTTHEARTIMEFSEPVDIVANISERPLEPTENSTYSMLNEFPRTFDVSISTANESKTLENEGFGSNSTIIVEQIPNAAPGFQPNVTDSPNESKILENGSLESNATIFVEATIAPGFQPQVTDSLVNDLTRDSVPVWFEESTHLNINETDSSTNIPILFETTRVSGVSDKINESVNNTSGTVSRDLGFVVDPIAVNEVTSSAVPTPPSPLEGMYKEPAMSSTTFNNVDVHLEGSLHTSTFSPDVKLSSFVKTVYDTGLGKRSSLETTTSDMLETKIPDNSSIADVTNSLFPMVQDTNITETSTETVPDFGKRNIQDASFIHRESMPMFDVNVTDDTALLKRATDSTRRDSLQVFGVNSATSIPDVSGHTVYKSSVAHGGDIPFTEVNTTQTGLNTIEHQTFFVGETTPSSELNPSKTTPTLSGKEVNHLSFVHHLSEPLSDVSVTEPTPDIATEKLNNSSFTRRVDMSLSEVSNRDILEISTTGFDRLIPSDSGMGMGTSLVEKSTVSEQTKDGYFGQNNLLIATETIPFNEISETVKDVTTQEPVIRTTHDLPTTTFNSGNGIHTEKLIVMKDTEQSTTVPSLLSKVPDMLKMSKDTAIRPEVQQAMFTETAPEVRTATSTKTTPEVQPAMFRENLPGMKTDISTGTSDIQTTAFAETAPEIQTTTFAETAPEIQTTAFAKTAPEIQTTAFAETAPEIQTTTFAKTAPEIQTTAFAETAPEIQTTAFAETAPEIQTTTFAKTAPEIQTTAFAETAPEIQTTAFAETAPEIQTTTFAETAPEIQTTAFAETAPEIQTTTFAETAPEIQTTAFAETAPEIQTTTFAETAPEIQTTSFAKNAPEIQTTAFAETAPEIQTTTFAKTAPEIQTTAFAETAPEIKTTTFAKTAQEIQTTTFAETAPEVQTTAFAETAPEIQTTTFAETAHEIQTTTFAETATEIQTTTFAEIVPEIVEDIIMQENIPNEFAIHKNKDYIKSSADANVPSNLLIDIEKQIIPEIKPSLKTSFDVKATSIATNIVQSTVSVTESAMGIEKSTEKTKETPKPFTVSKVDTAVVNEAVPEPIKPKHPSNIDNHINIPTTPGQSFNMIEDSIVVSDEADPVNTKSDKAGDTGMNVYFDTGSSKSSAFEMNNDTYIIVVGAIVGLVVLAVVIGIFCHNGRKRRSEKVNISGNNAEAVNHQNQAFDNEAADAEQGTIVVQNAQNGGEHNAAQNGGEHNAVSPEVNGTVGDKSADMLNGNIEL